MLHLEVYIDPHVWFKIKITPSEGWAWLECIREDAAWDKLNPENCFEKHNPKCTNILLTIRSSKTTSTLAESRLASH